MRADARPGAHAAGARLTEDEDAVYLASGRRIASPALRWSARTPLRARGSVLVAGCRWRFQRRAPVMRLALHPGDLDDAAVTRSVTQALRQWTAGRRAQAYSSLLS
jgi:hypothetical protein